MPYTNVHRGARISPTKVRPVADLVRGKPVAEAMMILKMSKRRAAVLIRQAVLAAQANADQAEVDIRSLVVSEISVDGGPVLNRWRPKDRGRAFPIRKRTSHITVVVDTR